MPVVFIMLPGVLISRVKIVSETSKGDDMSRDQIKVQASFQILRFKMGLLARKGVTW